MEAQPQYVHRITYLAFFRELGEFDGVETIPTAGEPISQEPLLLTSTVISRLAAVTGAIEDVRL